MKRRLLFVGGCCIATLGLGAASGSAEIKRSGVGVVETIQCRGQNVHVEGTNNKLTLLGECPAVHVEGVGNSIKVEVTGSIDVDGMTNRVVWSRGLDGRRPRISNDGINNTVRQGDVGSGAAAGGGATAGVSVSENEHGTTTARASSGRATADMSVSDRDGRQKVVVGGVTVESGRGTSSVSTAPADRTLNGSAENRTIDCRGESVTINGSSNDLSFRGECRKITVNGSNNTITIEAAAAIAVLGSFNQVSWGSGVDGQDPEVSNLGRENSIRQSRR